VAVAVREALVRGLTSEDPVNLAFGTRRTVLELVAELEALVGHDLAREHREPRQGDVRHSQADGSRLATLLPDVAPIEFRHGLESSLAWFRALPAYAGAVSCGEGAVGS
jgi:UDP-glucose 4-epimerase